MTINEQREDFLTEMLAWMVDTLPQFAKDYVQCLCESATNISLPPNFNVQAETQIIVEKGRIDLIIYTDCGIGFICEHKVDSELAERQLEKYKECIPEIQQKYKSETGIDTEYYIVLVTKSDIQHKQKSDIKLIWYDIFKYFYERLNSYDDREKLIVEQFLDYLTEEEMGMKEAVNIQGIKSFCAAFDMISIFENMIRDYEKNINWAEVCPGLDSFVSDYNNNIGRLYFKDDRRTIEFGSWRPSIFAGLIYKNKLYNISCFDNEPLLVIAVEYDKKRQDVIREKNWYNEMVKEESIIRNQKGFFMDPKPGNKNITLILCKPLSEVLNGVEEDYRPQKEKVLKEIINGINLILEYNNRAKI